MEIHDSLEEQLAAFDRVRSYTTEELVKENELERTERVRDAQGRLFLRKYIKLDSPEPHAYERLAGVEHPNLQKVCEAVRAGDTLVVVCEWVQGLDLRQFVKAFGLLDRETACKRMMEVCRGLSVMHSAPGGAVIHRDVSPGNIIISKGRAVLVDLGIARSWRAGADHDTHLWGTSGYAAPEQFGFRQTDARADVYGAGMCLRFALTGADPAQSDVRVPQWAAGIVGRATGMDPATRYGSAAELGEVLGAAAWFDGGGGADAPQGERARVDASAAAAQRRREKEKPKAKSTPLADLRRLEERLEGATKRSTLLKWSWRAYQACAVLFVIAGLMQGVREAALQTTPFNSLLSFLSYFFMVVAPCWFSANLLNVNNYVPWLGTYRHLKLLALCVGSVCLLMLIATLESASGTYVHYTPSS